MLAWIIAAPVLVAMSATDGWGLLDVIGTAVWLIGFGFEAIGDYQLTAFIRDPANKGRTMQSGLWRYTRHPNYFGDATHGGGCGSSRPGWAAGGRSSRRS